MAAAAAAAAAAGRRDTGGTGSSRAIAGESAVWRAAEHSHALTGRLRTAALIGAPVRRGRSQADAAANRRPLDETELMRINNTAYGSWSLEDEVRRRSFYAAGRLMTSTFDLNLLPDFGIRMYCSVYEK